MAKIILLGAGPVNEAERLVVEHLSKQLPESHTLIPNVEIHQQGRPPYDYDLIVLAPHAVYVVEVKGWRGGIHGDDHTWTVAGKHHRPNPFRNTNNKARVLKSQLIVRQPAIGNFWVQAVVTIADDQGQLDLHGTSHSWICRYTELPALLQNKDVLGGATTDLQHYRGPLESTLQQICQGRQSGPKLLGSYEIVETLLRRDHVTEYLGRHTLQASGKLVRLRAFSYNPYLPDDARRKQMEIIKREVEALQKIGGHPNLIVSTDLFTDPSDPNLYYSVTDWSDTGTLRELLSDQETPLSLNHKLELIEGIAAGLAAAHAADVIHRDVRPENILIGRDGQPRLMNFDHARLVLPGSVTVGPPRPDPDVSQAYIAPELLTPAITPTPAADVYSLGCILFEMLTGTVLFYNPEEALIEDTSGGGPLVLAGVNIPERLNELTRRMMKPNVKLRPQTATEVLQEIRAIRQAPSGTIQANAPSAEVPAIQPTEPNEFRPGEIIDDKYLVRAKVGFGGFSCVYQVYDHIRDRSYALKVFNELSVGIDNLRTEIRTLQQFDHPHIAKAIDWGILRSTGRPYLVSEFVEGEVLRRYTSPERRLSVSEAVQAIECVLRALEYIHRPVDRIQELETLNNAGELDLEEYHELGRLQQSGFLHRDIKPENLILRQDGTVTLVDFNIAAQYIDANITQAGTPPYMLPETGIMRWSEDADLFATGIVLYELVTGRHPYPDRQPNTESPPTDPCVYVRDLAPDFAQLLLKSVSCDATIRYHSARRFRLDLEALQDVYLRRIQPSIGRIVITLEPWEESKPNYNPYVTRLLTLYSQARRDNSGTRGLEGIAKHTYVETRLDRYLQPAVLDGQYRLVIITGNAGDGKTAFIQNLEEHAQQGGGHLERPSPNSSRFVHHGIRFITNYDGSQDEGAERANDSVLNEFFDAFSDAKLQTSTSERSVHLIAINKGRILDFLTDDQNNGRFGELSGIVTDFFDPDTKGPLLPEWLCIVDLNFRSVVAKDDEQGGKSIFDRQLDALLRPEFWGPCQQCGLKERCFIKYNADTLSDPASGLAVRERLRTLFEIVHLRRKLHITMRDMRSALSWLLFQDHDCIAVANELEEENDPADRLSLLYHNAFATDATLAEGRHDDRLVQLLRQIDPAEVANPSDDRVLHFRNGSHAGFMTFENRSELAVHYLEQWVLPMGWTAAQNPNVLRSHRRKHQSIRRRAFYERRDDEWLKMLPYQQLDTFRRATANLESTVEEIKTTIVGGISIAEGARNIALASANICLRAGQTHKVKVKSFRLFPRQDFSLRLPRIPAEQYLEYIPDQIGFIHAPDTRDRGIRSARDAELAISLDILELLYQISRGQVPSPDELSGVYVNLIIFKNALAHLPYQRVLLTRDDEQFFEVALEGVGVARLRKLELEGRPA